jgi:UDP-N-acetylmuramoyl-tripeptide--D-alanyl-D-alanine ligase
MGPFTPLSICSRNEEFAALGALSTRTILHVITSLRSGRAASMLTCLAVTEVGARTVRHVVISLTEDGVHGSKLQRAGVELHCLGLSDFLRLPRALFRLTGLMRNIEPDVVMTWLYHADLLGTLAAIASGVGPRRVVWNRSCSSLGIRGVPGLLLTRLSPLPSAILWNSRLQRQAYESLGYRPRRWLRVPNRTRRATSTLIAYRQVWQFVCGAPDLVLDRETRLERARLQRGRSNATFIAITGSSLKSTTTKMLSHILSGVAPTRDQVAYNRMSACIQTLTDAASGFDYVVCEIGTHRPGDLKPMVDLLQPSIGIVTLVGLEHYSNFRTQDAIAQEKATLIDALPQDGLAILNCDDPHVIAMSSRTKARVLSFGESGGDYVIEKVRGDAPGALQLSIRHGGEHFNIISALTGSHNSVAVAAAFCCAHQLGVPPSLIQDRIASFTPLFGRCSVHRVEHGPIFILDTHKGPYYSFYFPISMMSQFNAPRKRIVVGQISDAGNTNPKYRDVYRAARDVADQVIFVGDNAHRSKATAEEIALGRFVEKRSVKEAAEFLKDTAIPGEVILVKSAQNLHLERVFLGFTNGVRCWEQECKKKAPCVACGKFGVPFEEHRKHARAKHRSSQMSVPNSTS